MHVVYYSSSVIHGGLLTTIVTYLFIFPLHNSELRRCQLILHHASDTQQLISNTSNKSVQWFLFVLLQCGMNRSKKLIYQQLT